MPGGGQAPLSAYSQAGHATTYLGTDLLGSVRLATNGSDVVTGAGAYDAWGNAQPNTANGAGQALLAALQAAAPFGYAGQYYDAGPGLYDMRARAYNPATGLFLSVDPLLAQTQQPYLYAGDNPVDNRDPSGQWLVPPHQVFPGCAYKGEPAAQCFGNIEQAAEDALVAMLRNQGTLYGGPPQTGRTGELVRAAVLSTLPGYFAFNVPVARVSHCTIAGSQRYIANIYDPVGHQFWDIERAGATPDLNSLQTAMRTVGLLWPKDDQYGPTPGASRRSCNATGAGCVTVPSMGYQYACGDGVNYLDCFGVDLAHLSQVPDAQASAGGTNLDAYAGGTEVNPFRDGAPPASKGIGAHHYFCYDIGCNSGYEWWVEKVGLIWWRSHGSVPGYAPSGYSHPGLAGIDFLLGNSLSIGQTCQGALGCGAATLWLMVNLAPVVSLVRGLANGGKALYAVVRSGGLAAQAETREALEAAARGEVVQLEVPLTADGSATRQVTLTSSKDVEEFLNSLCPTRRLTPGQSFPAGTLVATPRGEQAIQTLRVGEQVLAEDPHTGKVEAEAVQAVLVDPVSPLLAVQFSDGSAITVTANHPIYVDRGVKLAGPGWARAGDLRPGDEVRTVRDHDVMVMGFRRNAGRALVYTLTVAKDHTFWGESHSDHTFFVGTARVLVHNADGPCGEVVGDIRKFSDYALVGDKAPVFASAGYTAADAQELLDLYLTQARERFAAGDYALKGAPDQYGQRYTVIIDLPGKGAAAGKVFRLKSGWIVEADGKVKLVTPFSGNAD